MFILAIFCYALVVTDSSFKFEDGVIVLLGGRIKSLLSSFFFLNIPSIVEKHCEGCGLEFKSALDCVAKHCAS